MRLFYFDAMRVTHRNVDFPDHNSNGVLTSAERAQSYRELVMPLANVIMILFSFFDAMRVAQCKFDT
jgi:hypothetical protein